MRTRFISPIITVDQASQVEGDFLNRSHFHTLVRGDAEYRDSESGRLVARLQKQVLHPDNVDGAYEHLREVNQDPRNRAMAVAGKGASMPKIRQDGQLSPRHWVIDEVLEAAGNPKADFLGFYDYDHGCRETYWTGSHRNIYEAALPFVQEISDLFRVILPDEYERQAAEVAKVPADFTVPGTVYTTITVNKNFRTTAHKDAGDLREGTGCMATLGNFDDGFFVIPQYGLAVDYQPGDVLFADVHLLHGNCPFEGERLTTVLYCRERMNECDQQESVVAGG